MRERLPDAVSHGQPHSVEDWRQSLPMGKNLKIVVAENVRTLLGLRPDDRGATAALIKLKISNGDATRTLKGQTSIGLDKLAELAKALKVEPWQLLVPGLDPTRMPALEPVSFRWPFRQVDPEVITGLSGSLAQQVENGLLATLAAVGVASRKPQARAA